MSKARGTPGLEIQVLSRVQVTDDASHSDGGAVRSVILYREDVLPPHITGT